MCAIISSRRDADVGTQPRWQNVVKVGTKMKIPIKSPTHCKIFVSGEHAKNKSLSAETWLIWFSQVLDCVSYGASIALCWRIRLKKTSRDRRMPLDETDIHFKLQTKRIGGLPSKKNWYILLFKAYWLTRIHDLEYPLLLFIIFLLQC